MRHLIASHGAMHRLLATEAWKHILYEIFCDHDTHRICQGRQLGLFLALAVHTWVLDSLGSDMPSVCVHVCS